MVQTFAPTVAIQDVCDLLAAAGPLTSRDIAGGLGVTPFEVWHSVRNLLDSGDLREDEFGRYRLAGACAQNAF